VITILKRIKYKNRMRNILRVMAVVMLVSSCTTTEKLTYLNNLPESSDPQYFPYEMADYRVQYRDILYVDIKMMTPEGTLENVLQGSSSSSLYMQGESGQYLMGYNIDKEGNILLPVLGSIYVAGMTLSEIREKISENVDQTYRNAYVDVKLLGFKFTVLGEARSPGNYVNYNDYLTVFEAIGRAGGVGDFGRRDRVLVIRTTLEGSKTYRLDLHDKSILTSEAYYIMPNDVLIIEPQRLKTFSLNLPSISLLVSGITGIITTTLLLINYFGN
jgi:polysaccharide export outer membrane protein